MALLRHAALDGLTHPAFQQELPARVRADVKRKAAKAGAGDYATITLGDAAGEVRAAALRLKAKPRLPKKLADVLGELSRVSGY
jgi:DNA-binding response OmpR family regulator